VDKLPGLWSNKIAHRRKEVGILFNTVVVDSELGEIREGMAISPKVLGARLY
jgi:hypothetical protein